MNAADPQECALIRWQGANDVISRSEREVGIFGLRRNFQKQMRKAVRFAQIPKRSELVFLDQTGIIRSHARSECQSEERIWIGRVGRDPQASRAIRARGGIVEF